MAVIYLRRGKFFSACLNLTFMKDLYNLIHLFILSKTRAQFYPTAPPYGSNWGHKIADFEFLPYISFIVAFIASECIQRYWESIYGESKWLVSFTPRPPAYGSNWGHKIAALEFLPSISFIVAFVA